MEKRLGSSSPAAELLSKEGIVPHFYILGGQKCGSTFVHRIIAKHPDIYLPHEEIRYLEDEFYDQGGKEKFLSLFEGQAAGMALGIKNPGLLSRSSQVIPRIQQLSPQAKFVAVFRNPVDRFLSDYYHQIRYGFFPPIELEEGVKLILDRKMGKYQLAADYLIENGMYHKHLKRFLETFPEDQFRVVLYDQLSGNLEEVFSNLYQFLEVDPAYAKVQEFERTFNPSIYSIPLLRIRQGMLHRKYEYHHDRAYFHPREMSLADQIMASLYSVSIKVGKRFVQNKKPKLPAELRERLLGVYQQDIQSLGAWLDQDLSHWQ